MRWNRVQDRLGGGDFLFIFRKYSNLNLWALKAVHYIDSLNLEILNDEDENEE